MFSQKVRLLPDVRRGDGVVGHKVQFYNLCCEKEIVYDYMCVNFLAFSTSIEPLGHFQKILGWWGLQGFYFFFLTIIWIFPWQSPFLIPDDFFYLHGVRNCCLESSSHKTVSWRDEHLFIDQNMVTACIFKIYIILPY